MLLKTGTADPEPMYLALVRYNLEGGDSLQNPE